MLSVGIIITLTTVLIMHFNLDSVLKIFGATEDILTYSPNYLKLFYMDLFFK